MLWSAHALGTRTLLWFEHGCFGQRMLSEHEHNILCFGHGCFGQRMLSEQYALGTRTLLWSEHGCFGQRMLWEHERYYGCYKAHCCQSFSPNLYTLDPKIQPNEIAAELFAFLRRSSSDALSVLFWRTSAWRPLKGLHAKFVRENN